MAVEKEKVYVDFGAEPMTLLMDWLSSEEKRED
jgi:hypothetical protein